MLVEVTIPKGSALAVIEQADGSAIVSLPESVIRQAYCDLVYAEIRNRKVSLEPRRALQS